MKVIDVPVVNPETGHVVSLSFSHEELIMVMNVGLGFLMTQGMMKINEQGEYDLETMDVGGNA